MTESPLPRAPQGAGPAGRRLWRSITESYELERHELHLLTQACRTVDVLEALHAVAAAGGPMVDGRVHPALVEARQQRITFARLLSSLRVPLGADETHPASTSPTRRLQRRGAARGVY